MANELVAQPGKRPLSTIPGADEWATMTDMAKMLIDSGFVPPALDSPAKVIAVLLTGRELGIGGMHACRSINIVQGKPTLSAELMLALCYRNVPGFQFVTDQSTDQLCKVRGRRAGSEWVSVTFTRADAERAGLLGKSVWKQYPATMLMWRAVSKLCKIVGPDAISGVYTPEELDADPGVMPDDAAGEVITVTETRPGPQKEEQVNGGSQQND